jgi:hypothetical protein
MDRQMIRKRCSQRRARPSLFRVVVIPRRRSSQDRPRIVEFSRRIVCPKALAIAVTDLVVSPIIPLSIFWIYI